MLAVMKATPGLLKGRNQTFAFVGMAKAVSGQGSPLSCLIEKAAVVEEAYVPWPNSLPRSSQYLLFLTLHCFLYW